MPKPEIYVSTDVEADGPIPGPHSMLSFGSAAFQADGTLLDTFSANLETLEGAAGDPKTMAWWEGQPEAWAACRKDLEAPAVAVQRRSVVSSSSRVVSRSSARSRRSPGSCARS